MQKTKDQLKEMFSDGKTPDGRDFADLIDSCRNETDREIYVDGVPLAESVRGKATKDELESARQSLQRKIDAKGADILSLETQIGQIAGQIDSMPACQCDTSQFYTKGEVDSMLANLGGGADSDGPSCECDMSGYVTRDELTGGGGDSGEAGGGILSQYATTGYVDSAIQDIQTCGCDMSQYVTMNELMGVGFGGGDDGGGFGILTQYYTKAEVDVMMMMSGSSCDCDMSQYITRDELTGGGFGILSQYYTKAEVDMMMMNNGGGGDGGGSGGDGGSVDMIQYVSKEEYFDKIEVYALAGSENFCLSPYYFADEGWHLVRLERPTLDDYGDSYGIKILRNVRLNLTSFDHIFAYWKDLEVVSSRYGDVRRVTSLAFAFEHCTSLVQLDIESWNVSECTNMMRAFQGCFNLKNFDCLSRWDVSNVTDMSGMFAGCRSMRYIGIGQWDVHSVSSFEAMFTDCESLIEIDLHGWNANASSYNSMFNGCTSLKKADLRGWTVDVPPQGCVSGTASMFEGCTSLEEVDLSGWTINEHRDLYCDAMFYNCTSLLTIRMAGCSAETIAKIDAVKPSGAVIVTE